MPSVRVLAEQALRHAYLDVGFRNPKKGKYQRDAALGTLSVVELMLGRDLGWNRPGLRLDVAAVHRALGFDEEPRPFITDTVATQLPPDQAARHREDLPLTLIRADDIEGSARDHVARVVELADAWLAPLTSLEAVTRHVQRQYARAMGPPTFLDPHTVGNLVTLETLIGDHVRARRTFAEWQATFVGVLGEDDDLWLARTRAVLGEG